MKNRKLVVISTLLLSLGLTACGNDFPSFASYEQGDDGSFHHEFVPYDNGKRIETITLSENDVKLNINDTKEYQINATFSPSDAANPYLYYESLNPDIVSVDDDGKVSIITTGSASVTVFSDTGVRTELNLDIYKPVEGISILPHVESDTGYVCDIQETRQFAIGYTPNDTTQVGVTWSIVDSNDFKPGEVSIDENGLLTVDAAAGTKNASFLVKAISIIDENIVATEKVTVNDDRVYAESVAIYDGDTDVSDAQVEVTLGETLSLSAKTTPEETTAGKVYWESSNPTVVSVDENGLLTALKAPASADITATVDGHSAKVTVNTVKIDVESVTLSETSLALTKGGTADLVATVSPANASIKDVRFIVESGEQYVGVDQDGKVTARASTLGGEAVIKCVSVDNPEKFAVCNVTVTNKVVSIEVISQVQFLHNGAEETDLSVAALPYDADPFDVTWTSSDESIATVDGSGHVTTNNTGLTGYVTFTATVDDTSISHGVTIQVIDPLPEFAWGIAGTKSGWALDETAPFVESEKEGDALYTYKTEYEFEVGDEWKVTNTKGEWVYNNLGEVGINIEKSTIGAVAISGEDRNISMNFAGKYEITLNVFDGAEQDDSGNFYSGIEIIAIGKDLPGQPRYAYVLNEEEPVELTQGVDPDGNPQLEALGIEMSAGDTLLFENIAPDVPEVLTSLVIGGDDDHGFTIGEGVLVAGKDGTFNFYVKLAYGNDVVYIAEETIEPIYAYVLNNNDPVVLEECEDPEGNPQLEAKDIVMESGDTILFENIAPKTPEPLNALTIAGDDHGFTIVDGVLTAPKDGTFSFFVKLIYGGDVVYISESAGPTPVEPIYAYVLNENEPVVLEEGTDPEGNPQLEAKDIVMEDGDTILFENIAPKTPEPLNALTIAGDDHGFTIVDGVLTAPKDGTFSFFVKLIYGGDVVYISETVQAAKFGYKLNDADYADMSYNTDESQWEIIKLDVEKNDTITIANVAPTTPEVLTKLKIDGEDYGFTIANGVLTSPKDGNFSFFLKPAQDNDVIYIYENVKAASFGYKLNDADYADMSYNTDESQWEIIKLDVEKNDTITIANVAPDIPEVLTGLKIEGEDYGFTVASGVLTAPKDGNFSFFLKPAQDNGVIYIYENVKSASFGYKLNDADYADMSYNTDECQWEIIKLDVEKNDTITIANVAPTTPEVLTKLKIEGEDYGFTVASGVLTAPKDGNFSFFLKPAQDNDVIYIFENALEPIYGYKLNSEDYEAMSFNGEKSQWELLDFDVSENDTIAISNIAPTIPEPLSELKIGGDAHGFTILNGVLTASETSNYSFYLVPEFENDTIYIVDNNAISDFQIKVGEATYNLTLNGTPLDPSYTEYYITDLDVKAGDVVRFIDNTKTPAVTFDIVDMESGSSSNFTNVDGSLKCSKDGTYDFYLKLKDGEDKIYIAEYNYIEFKFTLPDWGASVLTDLNIHFWEDGHDSEAQDVPAVMDGKNGTFTLKINANITKLDICIWFKENGTPKWSETASITPEDGASYQITSTWKWTNDHFDIAVNKIIK